jgi:hypothetical protein
VGLERALTWRSWSKRLQGWIIRLGCIWPGEFGRFECVYYLTAKKAIGFLEDVDMCGCGADDSRSEEGWS